MFVPPTFFVFLFVVGAALLSPFIAVAGVALAARPGTRVLGKRMLIWGVGGAALAPVSNLVLSAALSYGPTVAGTAADAGAGFTLATALLVATARGHADVSASGSLRVADAAKRPWECFAIIRRSSACR